MKFLDLFTAGYCNSNSIEEFMESDVAEYISRVYGRLRYTVDNRPNFIKVYKLNHKYLVTNNLFFNRFPGLTPIGSIVPPTLDYHTAEDELGGTSVAGMLMDRYGYIREEFHLPPKLIHQVENSFYINSGFEMEADMVHVQTDGKYYAQNPLDIFDQKYQITAEAYNATMSGIKWFSHPFLEQYKTDSKSFIIELFNDNYTIARCKNPRSSIQRMIHQDSMSRHMDSNTTGLDDYLANSLTWVCSGEFEGRRLIIGERSENDLARVIKESIKDETDPECYGIEPLDYEDKVHIKPKMGRFILLNSFNPLFYHGVEALIGKGAVHTIINDFQPA